MSAYNFQNDLEHGVQEDAEELYETAPCGYLTTALDGRILKVNQTFLEWTGYNREELTGTKRFVDLLTVGGRIFYETHFNLLLRMQRSVDEIALDIVRKDGHTLPSLINARQKRSAAGEPVSNRFTIFNSSERRMYERQLLESRDLWQTTLSSIGDGVVSTDAGGRITFMNPVARTLSGWNDDAINQPIDEVFVLMREETGERIENPLIHALRTSSTVGLENHTVLLSRDGRTFAIDDSASTIRNENGDVIGAVLVFRDVSERRRVERALDEAHVKLTQYADELKRSNEDLEQFAYVASHDLRSPLHSIANLSELVVRTHSGSLTPEAKDFLRLIRDNAKRMSELISALLAYSRLNDAALNFREPVSSQAAYETAIANLRSAIEESGAVVERSELPEVLTSRAQLIQVFQNLISNAIQYRGEASPKIVVHAARRGEFCQFSVRDNGPGIPERYHSVIFEPFKRLHGAERPGSGIGLAFCRKFIERGGGAIWVESEEGRGATFVFTLPAANPPASQSS